MMSCWLPACIRHTLAGQHQACSRKLRSYMQLRNIDIRQNYNCQPVLLTERATSSSSPAAAGHK